MRLRSAAPLFLAVLLPAQAPAPDVARMHADLFFLAGPECRGRATGQPGQRLAAAYIARRMKENGLAPLQGPGMGGATPYHFPYRLQHSTLDLAATTLRCGSASLLAGKDFIPMMPPVSVEGDALFLGYGVHAPDLGWDDYKGVEAKGRFVVVLSGHPHALDGRSEDERLRLRAKIKAARDAGALGLVEVQPWTEANRPVRELMLDWAAESYSLEGRAPRSRNALTMSESAALAAGLDAAQARRQQDAAPAPLPPRGLGHWRYEPKVREDTVEASDLAALIPGQDPKVRDEVVVVSAHHDHVGFQGGAEHPGADDNASGTVGILEAGRILAKAHPRRSILILSVSGEELGLFGSEAFLDHSPIPLPRLKADINIDMVGREGLSDLTVTPSRIPSAVGTLTERARALAPAHGFSLRPDADPFWERSDHYNFFKRGIPAVFFFDGMTADYHKPGDTPDKIDLAKVAKVVTLVRDLALDVANAEDTPKPLPDSTWASWTWPTAPGPGASETAGAAKSTANH
ncbi:MAG TPA: M28 family peptidase [Holophagaceae bacterium]|nr:M28 family peptidase [Holophagaceae bacterium]